MIEHDRKHAGCALKDDERTRCEIWTRVMGYHRPVSEFNPGKTSEHRQRRYFIEQPGDLESGWNGDNSWTS